MATRQIHRLTGMVLTTVIQPVLVNGLPKQRWRCMYHLVRHGRRSCSHGSVSTAAAVTTPSAIYGEVTVTYQRGLPVVLVPLPSRREKCRFTLKPISHNVGDFLHQICSEDKGIDRIGIRTPDGVRIASSTSIESLMQCDFHLIMNDLVYYVSPPESVGVLFQEEKDQLSNVRHLVNSLYEALNVEEHQLKKEKELFEKLESLKVELQPLEQKKKELEHYANRRNLILSWLGLGLMASQFGILARLTWWEYSWDIMEPVTYFVTYGTTMLCYAYFVLTKQEYILPDVRDRHFLVTFHKHARKLGLDVGRYNELKDSIAQIEQDLSRLRDPLFLHISRHNQASLFGNQLHMMLPPKSVKEPATTEKATPPPPPSSSTPPSSPPPPPSSSTSS